MGNTVILQTNHCNYQCFFLTTNQLASPHPRDPTPGHHDAPQYEELNDEENVEQASGEGAGSLFSPAHRPPGSRRSIPQTGTARRQPGWLGS